MLSLFKSHSKRSMTSDDNLNTIADLNGKLAIANDEMCYRERNIGLIDMILRDVEENALLPQAIVQPTVPKLPRPQVSTRYIYRFASVSPI